MEINLAPFKEPQRKALLDLLVLSMYLDRHLEQVEDARVERLLTAMGYPDEYDRQREFRDAVTRVRPHVEGAAAISTHAAALSRTFTTPEQQRQVLALLEDLLSCDGQVNPEEVQFLEQLREQFRR